MLPLVWGYSVTAYIGAAGNGLGHPTQGRGTCVHRWWSWFAVKCHVGVAVVHELIGVDWMCFFES